MFKKWGIFFLCLTATLKVLAQEPPVPEPEVLDAAVVRADDHYIRSFLAKLSKSLPGNDPDNAPDWRSRLYSKIELDITNIEDVIDSRMLRKNLGFVLQYADSSALEGKVAVPAIFSENLSEVFHSQSPSFNREYMRASRISGFKDDNIVREFTGSYLLKANFFKPAINIVNLSIPNPAHESAHIFYNYYLVDSLQVEGRKTYVLRFHPKKLVTSPTFDGEMLIDAGDFGIRSVHASLSKKSNVNWLRHLDLSVENRRLAGGKWFYGKENTLVDLSVTTSETSGFLSLLLRREMHYSLPVFEPIADREQMQKDNAVVMRDVIRGDDNFWRLMRPLPLSAREKGIYDMVSTIQDKPFYKWTYAFLDTVISGYYEIEPWKIEVGRWERTLSRNEMEGLRLQFGGRTLYTFSEKLRLNAYGAYGFRDHQWKGMGYGMVVYLASISGIDGELYEAALIDGASKWKQTKYITIPLLRPIMSIMLILAVGSVFRSDFGLFYQATRNDGRLVSITNTIDVFVYKALLVNSNINISSSSSFLQSVCGCIMVIAANLAVRKIDPEAGLF